jgi:hypothetical protein
MLVIFDGPGQRIDFTSDAVEFHAVAVDSGETFREVDLQLAHPREAQIQFQ